MASGVGINGVVTVRGEVIAVQAPESMLEGLMKGTME
jgi:hypothetical protein